MNIHFTRLATGYPEPLVWPADTEESWRVYHASAYSTFRNCFLNQDLKTLDASDPKSAKHARSALIQINKNAYHGIPLERAFEGVCHESGFRICNQHNTIDVNVWRIRKSAVRVYWCYIDGCGKTVMVLRIFTKREDKNFERNPDIQLIGNALLPFFHNPTAFEARII